MDKKLEELLHWLGAILDDLGNVMATHEEVAAGKHGTKFTTCLNEPCKRRNNKLS